VKALSDSQWLALAHLAQHGPAHCLPGQIWTSEPDAWERGERSVLDDYSIRRQTLEALAARRLVERDDEGDTYSITRAGKTQLALFHYQQQEQETWP
jgi:hypothetical protein